MKIDLKIILKEDIEDVDSCEMFHLWKTNWEQISILHEGIGETKRSNGRSASRDSVFGR
jgi:hypothetical protein